MNAVSNWFCWISGRQKWKLIPNIKQTSHFQQNLGEILTWLIRNGERIQKIDYFQKKSEEFEQKEYFRKMFSIKSQITKSVKSHYLSNKKFAFDQNVKSKLVQFLISKSVFLCPLEREIRNINCDYQQTQYIKEVLKIRLEAHQ